MMGYYPIAEKVIGFTHQKSGLDCQDAFGKCRYKGILFLAVADGHGSAACKYSDVGAKKAVESFIETMKLLCKVYESTEQFHAYLNKHKQDKIPQGICGAWERKVKHYHALTHKDEFFAPLLYGSTLLGLAIFDDFIFGVQLGDGDMLAVNLDGQTERIITPEKILGTETASLSSPDSWQKMLITTHHYSSVDDLPALYMLSTDGLANSYISDDAFLTSGRDYVDLITENGIGIVRENLAGWLNETTRDGCGDDITLALAVNERLSSTAGNKELYRGQE